MRIVHRTISISRRPEEVFDFFTDLTRAADWRQYVRTMERIDEGPLRAGSRIHVTMELMGEPYIFDMEVLTCERPSRWRHRSNETDFRGYVEYRFEREPDGTKVTMTIEAKPAGLWGWLGLPVLWLSRNKSYPDQLPRLKRAMEAS